MVDIHVLTTASGRLAAIAPLRGVWREIEAEIERRNASGATGQPLCSSTYRS